MAQEAINNIQEQLINKIKAVLPMNENLVQSISDVLNLSVDSAYRRIRGEKLFNIEEVAVEKLFGNRKTGTIKDLDLRRKTGCSVIGYKDEKGEYTVNPEAEFELAPNSKIIVLGRPEQIQVLNSEYNID